MQNKTLIISTTPFYGGGESFIADTLSKVDKNVTYFVKDATLYEKLANSKKYQLKSNTIISQIFEVARYVNANKGIKNIIFNGGNTFFFIPFLHAPNKIFYRHTTNMCVSNSVQRCIYIIMAHICYLFADKIVHVSKYSLNEQKILQSRAICIYHGVDIDKFYIEKQKANSFLFVGRLERSKGVDIIIEAFKSLPQGSYELNIVGKGELEGYVKSNVSADIKYWGFRNDVDSFYERADAFVTMPSNEAFGLTIIEAMKYSLPVITCKTGGVGEIVKDHVNGLLIPRNVESLIHAIEELQHDSMLYKKMGAESYAMVGKTFSRSNTIQKIQNILL